MPNNLFLVYTNMCLSESFNLIDNSIYRIQVFHVLAHDGTGGETLLVDGRNCAESLLDKHPESFHHLTKAIIQHEYFEPALKIRSLGTVLSVHPTTGEFTQIRYCAIFNHFQFSDPNEQKNYVKKENQNLLDSC